MNLAMDDDLKIVAGFMQANVPASKLVAVARNLDAIAPLLWGHYAAQAVVPLTISACDLQTQSAANE